jgi:hypothetical protein
VPVSYAYILKNIIHDWNDERAVEILSTCQRAMHEQGKILLIERLLQARGATSLETLCADLDMLVLGGGHSARERTEAEYRRLCRAAGCELARVIPIRSDHDYYVMEVASVGSLSIGSPPTPCRRACTVCQRRGTGHPKLIDAAPLVRRRHFVSACRWRAWKRSTRSRPSRSGFSACAWSTSLLNSGRYLLFPGWQSFAS